jgi:pyruvate kinase
VGSLERREHLAELLLLRSHDRQTSVHDEESRPVGIRDERVMLVHAATMTDVGATLRGMATAVPRRTKIVATIGPACASPEVLGELVTAGMDAARLNLSHGTHDDHAARAQVIRDVQEEAGRPLAIIGDLQGPKLRVGDLERPLTLTRGDEIVVVCDGGAVVGDGELPVAPSAIGEVLHPGHEVLIDDGLVKLRVEEVEAGRARCGVIVGGLVSSHKGVNLPGVPIPIPSLTRKDLEDLEFALELGVDYVALSFVRSAADVRDLKALIEHAGSHAHVIAKIEKAEAIDALDAVLADTDAVMVARGDLGVEIGPALVPLVQKRIILRALERGKPVITATQMLESMVHHPEPTRAEASDVANAILDGTSAVMLSGETAVGEYPIHAVATMDRIARAVEPSLGYRHQIPEATEDPTIGNATSNAACDIAEALGARAMLVPTFTGKTASAVARLRPRRPIAGLTHQDWALRQMALEWGVTPLRIPEAADIEELWASSVAAAREHGLVAEGDTVVITAGTAVNIPGSTNVIKVDVV